MSCMAADDGWVPAAVRQYGEARSRADGILDLAFAPLAGQTRLIHIAHRMPVQVQRAHYLDPADPTMAFVTVVTVGGGVLHGDRIRQTVRLDPGAHVHLTTQAATKIYRMECGYAAQETTISVGDNAILEYLPSPLILQRNARYAQRTTITTAPTATVIYGDVLIPGRIAMGERGVYDAVALITEQVAEPPGPLIWRDALVIEPAQLPDSADATATIGTLIALTQIKPARDLADDLHAALAAACIGEDIWWGVSDLPGGTGVIVRLLSPDSRAVQIAHRRAWNAIRQLTLGRSALTLRHP